MSDGHPLNSKNLLIAGLVFLTALLIFGFALGLRPFGSRGEAREALVVQSMVRDHEYILPLRNGTVIPSKPPMFHWLAASLSQLKGQVDEQTIRLPSALAAALLLATFYLFCVFQLGAGGALMAALILGTSIEFIRSATHARVDMVFALFLGMSLFVLFSALSTSESTWKSYGRGITLCASFLLGLAALAKGPAGLVMPWAVAGVFLVFTKKWKKIPYLTIIISFFLSALVAGVWYYLAYQKGGAEFIEVAFMRENVARVLGLPQYKTGHKSPFYVNPLLLVSGFFPWSVFFPLVGVQLWRERRQLRAGESLVTLFSLIWIGVFVLFFSLTSSKRSVYLLPCYPAAAFLVARSFSSFSDQFKSERTSLRFASGAIFLTGILVFIALGIVYFAEALKLWELRQLVEHRSLVYFTAQLFNDRPDLYIGFACSGGLLIYTSLRLASSTLRRSAALLGLSVFISYLTSSSRLAPPIAEFSSPRTFVIAARNMMENDKQLFIYDTEFYSLIYYLNQNVPIITSPPSLTRREKAYVMVSEDKSIDFSGLNFSSNRTLLRSPTPVAHDEGALMLVEVVE